MAGGDIPTGIWSPAGGWYADPKHWRRNTAICFLISAVIAVPALIAPGAQVFLRSAATEVHHTYPHRSIPSQKWCKNFPPAPAEE